MINIKIIRLLKKSILKMATSIKWWLRGWKA
jgi:hypothetical protein